MASQGKLIQIDVDQLILDVDNPRHEGIKKQEEALRALIAEDKAVEMALSIAADDANPMDLLGVVEKTGTGARKTYLAAEGNRRTAAYMLLLDPERIPAGISNRAALIAKLQKAASKAAFTRKRNCILFKTKKEAKHWIDIMHGQDKDGRGRRRWSSDQRERASGGGRNKKALALLDVGSRLGLVSDADRSKKLTTVQRYIGNSELRRLLGIEYDEKNRVKVHLSKSDTDKLFERFFKDVQDGKLSSRSDAKEVEEYAKKLIGELSLTEGRYEARDLEKVLRPSSTSDIDDQLIDDDDDRDDAAGPAVPRRRMKIGINENLERAFHDVSSFKLLSLYRSCANLNLSTNAPLITVGAWSILETLAALDNGSEAKFVGYFHDQKLIKLGFTAAGDRKAIVASLRAISDLGNATKHAQSAASFNGDQVANHMDVLVPLMLAVCRQISDTRAASPEGD